MKEIRLREIIGNKLGDETDLFIDFFMERFPNENPNITSYVNEWVARFIGGNPKIYMDDISKEIYVKLITKNIILKND